MGISSFCTVPCSLVFLLSIFLPCTYGQQLVPALFIFGDSVVDVGNNNGLSTIVKANFPPYGRDFPTHRPTGRFCNGRLAMDMLADFLSFSEPPPAYLSNEAQGNKIINGSNFASGASGYYEPTSDLYQSLSLKTQLAHYKEYQERLKKLIGTNNATATFTGGIHILSTGNSDFIQNYYINPLLNIPMTPDQFSDILVRNFANFVQELYDLGARKVGVTSLAPLGCLPAAITLFGLGSDTCVDRLNQDASNFNRKLNLMSRRLQRRHPDLTLVVFDIYTSLNDILKNPAENGFVEARRSCCGTGLVETSFLCNSVSIGTCSNASEYVFWDGFHPSEATNKLISESLLGAGSAFL